MNAASICGLAVRLARGTARRNRSTTTVLILGVFVVTVLALATAVAPVVMGHQRHRQAALAPVVGDAGGGDTGLLVADSLPSGRWNGHEISRYYYAVAHTASRLSVRIPGVGAPPRPGDYVASPALVRLIDSDPVVNALFRRLTRVGTIGSDGLVQPRELKAIIGVADAEGLSLLPVLRFGAGTPPQPLDDDTVLNTTVTGMTLALLWMPGVAFLVVITRLSARQSRSRVRALRGIGLSSAAVRLLQATEMVVLAMPGVVLGAVAFHAATRVLTGLPGAPVGFFSSDAHLPVGLAGAVIAGVLLVLGLLAAFAQPARWAERRRGGREPTTRARAARVGWPMVLVGLVYAAALPLSASFLGVAGVAGFWLSCGLVAAGFAMVGPSLVRSACDWLALRVRGAGLLVGLRSGRVATTSTTRLASLACVVIIVMLNSLAFMSILSGGNREEWESRLATISELPLIATDITGTVDLDLVRTVHDGPVAQLKEVNVAGRTVSLVFASCADLGELTAAPVQNCTGSVQWIGRARRDVPRGVLHEAGLDAYPTDQVVKLVGAPDEFTSALLLDPTRARRMSKTDGSSFYMLVAGRKAAETMAAFASLAPDAYSTLGDLDQENPDAQPYPDQIQWIIVGAVLCLMVAALGAASTLLGEAADRAFKIRGLVLLGAPRREFVAVQAVGTAVPLLVLGWSASLLGWLTCRGMHAVDDRATVPLAAVGETLLGTVLVALLLTVGTLPEALRGYRSVVRTEH